MKYLILSLFISTSSLANISFSHDGRPYDGKFQKIQISDLIDSTQNFVKYTEIYHDRMQGMTVTNERSLGRNMDCIYFETNVMEKIVCTEDDRPVDGALKVVTVELNENNLYDVTYFTSIVSRMRGGVVENTEVLARNLERDKFLK